MRLQPFRPDMQNDSSSSSTWPTEVPASGDEFASFLEFNDLDLDFPAFDAQAQIQQAQTQAVSVETAIKQGYNVSAYYEQLHHATMQKAGSTSDLRGRMTGLQVHQRSHPIQQHDFQQPMHYQSRIPPTPASSELAANHPQLVVESQQAAAMYEAQVRKQQEQMAFTPLGTPAVTPMDTQFQMRDYTVPGEYFSPLSSPAMHPQNQQVDGNLYYPFQMSDVSETTSPVDLNFDPTTKLTPATSRRGPKRRSPAGPSKPSPRSIKQSPAMKAQRKKPSSTSITTKDLQDAIASSRPNTSNGSQSLGPPAINMSSESPEPLLEMMPPPAIPSNKRSPYIPPGSQSAPVRPKNPVTPTSILKMQSTGPLQDLSLGEAAMNTEDVAMTDAPTPIISALQIGITSSMSPPNIASTPKQKAKADLKVPLKGKKRNSSSHPSPALRPKISPSIKPLLPEGILNAETSALYLASKSNYQNILDGTHLPGVTYPEALSENLTSKRTSHKIAEQGRRNRINTALQEIAALLPQTSMVTTDTSNAAQSSSKASTVEQAIDYIRQLQAEVKDTKEKLAVSETRLREIESAQGSVISTAVTPNEDSDTGSQPVNTEEVSQ